MTQNHICLSVLRFLIMIFVMDISVKGLHYSLTNTEYTWSKAPCTIATPVISFTTDGVKLAEGLGNTSLPVNTTAWVGYFKAFRSFYLIGCSRSILTESDLLVADLGECYTACNYTSVIGLRRDFLVSGFNCFCLHNALQVDTTGTECRKLRCFGPDSTSCVSDDDEAVTIYRPTGFTLEGLLETDRCLKVIAEQPTNYFAWDNCAMRHLGFCSTTQQSDEISHVITFPYAWEDIFRQCFKRNLYPGSLMGAENVNVSSSKDKTEYWTGIIRTETIYSFKDIETSNTSRKYAYVSNNSGSIYITFGGTGGEKMRVLCLGDGSGAGDTTTDLMGQTTTPVTSTEGVTSEQSSDNTGQTATPVTSSEGVTSEQSTDNTDDPLPTSAIIGVGVGGLILVVIVISCIVLLKKRYRGLPANIERTSEPQNAVTYYNMPEERHMYSDLTDNAEKSQTYATLDEDNSNENIRIPAVESTEYVNESNGYIYMDSKSAIEEYNYEKPDVDNM